MARDIDNLPLYDGLIKPGTSKLSDVWIDSLATFILTLQEYLTSGGMFVPRITTAERDALQNVTNGQLIYNTTTNKFQGFENNNWVNLI